MGILFTIFVYRWQHFRLIFVYGYFYILFLLHFCSVYVLFYVYRLQHFYFFDFSILMWEKMILI